MTRIVDTKVPSEQELVKEMVFVFQGIPGSFITCEGGKYSISTKVTVPEHMRALVLKLCEVGFLYTEVNKFTESRSGEVSYGRVRNFSI